MQIALHHGRLQFEYIQSDLSELKENPHARRHLKQCLFRAAVREHAARRVSALIEEAVPRLAVLAMFATPIVWMRWTGASVPQRLLRLLPGDRGVAELVIAWVIFAIAQVAVISLALGLIFLPMILAANGVRRREMGLLQSVLAIPTLALLVILANGEASSTLDILWAAAAAAILIGAATLLLVVFMQLFIEWAIEKWHIRAQPDAFVMWHYAMLIWLLRTGARRWYHRDFQRNVLIRLEIVALAFERYWHRQARGGDAVTKEWLRSRCVRIAAAIRSLKLWVLSPKRDSREQLIMRLVDDLNVIAIGEIDRLSQKDVTSRPVGAKLRGVMRAALVALSPTAGVWIVQHSSLKLEVSMLPWLTAAALGWAMISLLAALDPMLASKLTMLRDVRSFLRLPGTGN
jgi:hypothetical protein